MDSLWLVVGNFNDIKNPSEKKKDASFNWRANMFNDHIHRCCLMDVDLQGGEVQSLMVWIVYEKLD